MFRLSVFSAVLAATFMVPIGHTQAQELFNPTGRFDAQTAARDYIINRPTVSPYLNLLRSESGVSGPNYQTLVRPAFESRQRASQQQSSIRQLQSRVPICRGKWRHVIKVRRASPRGIRPVS